MINYYEQIYRIYQDGCLVRSRCREFLAEDNDPSLVGTKRTNITWENLEEFDAKHGHWTNFTIYNTRKGRRIDFFALSDGHTVKEWKTDETGLSYEITDAKISQASLKDIMNYYNSDLAIKYLLERGLTALKN